jgi:hypothetical protein
LAKAKLVIDCYARVLAFPLELVAHLGGRVFWLVLTARRNSEAVLQLAGGAFSHADGQPLIAAIDPGFPL